VTFTALVLLTVRTAVCQAPKALWEQAELLYNLDEPTTATDEKAAKLYVRIAKELAQVRPSHPLRIHSLIKAGNIEQTYTRHKQARQYYHQAIRINERPILDSQLLYEAYLYVGSSYYYNDIIDSATYFFEEAYALSINLKSNTLPDQQRLYNSLGAIYFLSGNYAQAINYFQNALRFIENKSPDYAYDYVSVASNIATCYQEMKHYDKAILLYKQLLPLQTRQEVIRQNLARTYYRKGNIDSAHKLYLSIRFQDPLLQIKALNDLGRINELKQRWRLAEKYYDSSLALNRRHLKQAKNKEQGLSYFYKAQLSLKQGLYDEGLFWCNRSLESIYWNFKSTKTESLPTSLNTSLAPTLAFEVLTLKASIFIKKYELYKQTDQLEGAVRTYRTAFLEAHFIKRNFDNDDARIFFNTNYQPLYNAAIAAAFDASQANATYIDDYLFFVETYKGSLLAHNMQQQAARQQVWLNPRKMEEEKKLKQLIAIYATRLGNAAESNKEQLQQRYAMLQVELSRLQQQLAPSLEADFYRYQQADKLKLAQIQETLPKGRAVISYYASDRFFYALAITRSKYHMAAIPKSKALLLQLSHFLQALKQQQQGQRFSGFGASFAIQTQLIAPLMPVIGGCKEWLLLPDGILSKIPFDALSTKPGRPHYVVQHHAITYHYSLLLMLTSSLPPRELKAIAFAPFAQKQSANMQMLPFSASEVAAIGNHILLNENASRKSFLQKANQYELIHLATHASIEEQEDQGWISFGLPENENKIFIPELYNLNLRETKLVVLSACETGQGNSTVGEGVMSIGRAFLYAGTNAVAATLWKADDRITAYLMQRFYFHLRQNKPAHLALQLSKKDLLNSDSINPTYKSPHYWSNFVFIGPAGPKPPADTNWVWYGLAAIFMAGGGGILYKKRRAKRHNTFLKTPLTF
jgi:CHAT domain-containing protein